jgi:hypothetical protein
MLGISRLRLLTALAALMLLPAATAGSAGAVEVFGITPAGEYMAVSLGPVTFSAGGYTIVCNLTLTGSIDDGPLQAIVGEPAGTIAGASISGCSGGTLTAVLGLPWSLKYEAFTGTLPAITSIKLKIESLAANFNVLGFQCLYRGAITATIPLTGTNPSRTGLLTVDETRALAKVSGSEICPTQGNLRATYAFTPEAIQLNPRVIISVGDSYISGEGGRWAGNTYSLSQNNYAAIDALGVSAYWDNGPGNAEQIPACHRSRAAEVQIGGGLDWLNLACSGAKVRSEWESGIGYRYWKPGLDFEDRGSAYRGQALRLKEFAIEWRRSIKAVVVSIGGNDFSFGYVVGQCLINYNASIICSNRNEIRALFEPTAMSTVKGRIRQGLLNVDRAMREAGLTAADYKMIVQNYMSPLPEEGLRFRYPQNADRTRFGGCGFYNLDASWANSSALGAINQTIAEAVTESGLTNILRLDLREAFMGRRLCETTVGLLEERQLTEGRQAGAVDKVEWVTQVRINTSGTPFWQQESLHPNYWGQLALRNCLRQAYNGGNLRGGACTIAGLGLTAAGEPRMVLQ